MNPTRVLMSFTAVVLAMFGLVATFGPDTVLARLGEPITPMLVLIVQITGALYLAFAMLDWITRDNLIGGIYSRTPALRMLWPLAVIYAALAISFGVVLVRHPVRATVT